MSNFLKCVDCGCIFITEHDLILHLKTFGKEHAQALKEMHKIAENGYCSCEFDDADRIQQDMAKAIKEYANEAPSQ
jgi:Mn-dependent DtxR family transcriptional regulator